MTTRTPGLTFEPESHVYRLFGHELPSVTQVLDVCGKRPDFSHVPAPVLEAARRRGQAVHAAAHYDGGGVIAA